jgi:putative membrane protein
MSNPDSTKLAEERTEFAEERTILASERTYAAWMRTGLTALVSGLAVVRFMREILAEWALLPVAAALLLFSLFSFAAAGWRYVHMGRRLADAEMPRVSTALLLAATTVLALGTLVTLASVLLR